MSRDDLERQQRPKNSNNNTTGTGSTYPSSYSSTEGSYWTSWLVPVFVVANIVVFVVVMYVNNCRKHNSGRFYGKCVAGFLGRFSFQPLKENPLFGPSSNT